MRFAGVIFGVALVLSGASVRAQTPESASPDKAIAAYQAGESSGESGSASDADFLSRQYEPAK